ncbi:hypothetical protein JYK14_14790 [Siccirubricoccus sp. KC 17139]|uniref:Glycosyltransferase RgtA/B/C/D-like domain-containing protein n=1 Tax=Siccirubricoccus soli TaxID=2899147 RepID=A0ABT1D650_9PROT|nr:hypothetical protein [Siccirubricoccus soli]MCO6417418.1 hypothetical protein [Siccirubricoccus soli]MCP2683553.1 hypothetical protein [Siccirubricoccus soli]
MQAGGSVPDAMGPRARAIMLAAGLASLILFFRHQLADGFALLLGDRHDAVIALSIMEHWWNVLRGLQPWDVTGYFHPVPGTLGYNDGYLAFSLLYSLPRALGADPFLAGELTNIGLRALGYGAMFALLRRAGRLPWPAAVLGAGLFTISNNLYIRGSHAQLFSIGLVPLLAWLAHGAAAALLEGRRGALLGWGAGFCLGFALALLTGFYMAWYCVFFATALLPSWLIVAGAEGRRRLWQGLRACWLPLLLLAGLALLLNLPFLRLYLPKAAETGMHPWPLVLSHAPSLLDVIHVGERNLLWGWLVRALNGAFRPGFPFWSEHMTGFPLLLLGLFMASLLWLAGPARGLDPARRRLFRAVAIATVVTWVLTLRFGEVTGWALVYDYFPGGKAPRVVARYQIFLAVPVVLLAMSALAAWAPRWPRPAVLAACALLVAEQVNLYAPLFLDHPLEAARLAAVPPPPAGCQAFYVSAARQQSRFGEEVDNPYNHNTEAMLVAAVRHIPTINGISTFNPPGWPDGIPAEESYRQAVRDWARRWNIAGLCALDLQRFTWSGPEDEAP